VENCKNVSARGKKRRPSTNIRRIIDTAASVQKLYSREAQKLGQAIELLRPAEELWSIVEANPSALEHPFLASRAEELSTYVGLAEARQKDILQRASTSIGDEFKNVAGSVATTANITSAFLETGFVENVATLERIRLVDIRDRITLAVTASRTRDARLAQLRNKFPSVATVLEQAEAVLYGGGPEAERGAVALIRQAFDQMLDSLATKDEVRQNVRNFDKDDKGHPSRRARLFYAADAKIRDHSRRSILRLDIEPTLSAYNELSEWYKKRDPVDTRAARAVYDKVRNHILLWADAVEV
jgi:hypothetical protein